LDVKLEWEMARGATIIRRLIEKYDIQAGIEPDSKELRIPEGFKIVAETTELPGIGIGSHAHPK
jgi:hypothetical protein